MQYNSRVLILTNQDYRETDRLVTLFTESKGKLTAIARGVKKPASSLRAVTQPFVYAELSMHTGKNLDLITQGQLLNFFPQIRQNTDALLSVVYILELLNKTLLERYPLPRFFTFTVNFLQTLDIQGLKPILIRYFEIALLKELGLQPQIDVCVNCRCQDRHMQFFSLSEGGGLCAQCADRYPGMKLSGETWALLRLLLLQDNYKLLLRVKPSAEGLAQLEHVLEKYLEYHLERRLAVPEAVRKLKQRLCLN